MRLLLALLSYAALTAIATTAAAQCPPQARLSCTMERGQRMEVCASAEGFVYRYGSKERADLTLSVPLPSADVTPWPGMGHSMWNSLTFYNRDHSYEVYTSTLRGPEEAVEAGVIVARQGKEIARLACQPQTITGNPMLFESQMYEAGFCPQGAGEPWRRSRRGCP